MAARFELTFGRTAQRRADSQPTRVLVLIEAAEPALASAKPLTLNLDNFDSVLAAQIPDQHLGLNFGATQVEAHLQFAEMESFEPHHIAAGIQPIAELQSLRKQLQTPATAPHAAARLLELLGAQELGPAGRSEAPPDAPNASTQAGEPDAAADSDFSQLLKSTTGAAPTTGESSKVRSFIERVLAEESGSIKTDDYASLAELSESTANQLVADAIADPAIRALERTWRGLHWLVSNVDLDETVNLFVLPVDISRCRAQLLAGPADPSSTDLHQALASMGTGADGSAMEVVALDFDIQTPDDIDFLEAVTDTAARLGAMVFANAPDALFGSKSTLLTARAAPGAAEDNATLARWADFQVSQAANHCAVAAPRLLLRAPYGRRGERSDLRSFEELGARPAHERFVWGNPAYGLLRILCAALETAALEAAVPVASSIELEIVDMPLAIFNDGSGEDVKPAAEAYLSEQDIAALAARGVMTFLSYRNRNAVKLSGFHCVA